MKKTQKNERQERRSYVSASVRVIEVTPQRVVCISTGDSTVSNPFQGENEEIW